MTLKKKKKKPSGEICIVTVLQEKKKRSSSTFLEIHHPFPNTVWRRETPVVPLVPSSCSDSTAVVTRSNLEKFPLSPIKAAVSVPSLVAAEGVEF